MPTIINEGFAGGDVAGTFEGTRTFSEKWVYYASMDTRPIHIHDFIPVAYGSSHPDFFQAYCLDKKASSRPETVIYDKGPLAGQRCIVWDIDIGWGPLEPRLRDGELNPLSLPPRWSFKGEKFDKILYEDYEGEPLVNSAGDYFDPPIVRPQVRGVLTARVNLALDYVNLPALVDLANRLNSDQIGYWPAKTLMSVFSDLPFPSYNQYFDLEYYEMEFNFHYNPDTWEEEIINMGYRELDGDGNPIRILDKSGQDIQKPAFLDLDGHKLEHPITEIYTLPFKLEEEIAYADSYEFLGTDWKNV